jgi:precorrin-6B methylase 2
VTLSFSDVRRQVDTLGVAERFFDSALLFTLFDLGVFRRLAEGAATLDELAEAVGGDRETLRAVLDGAVATSVLTRDDDGRYEAPEALARCLGDEGSDGYLGEWITFLAALAPHIGKLADAVRTGKPSGTMVDGGDGDDAPARAMTAAMDAYARTRGAEFATKLDFGDTATLLDIGCGPGTYSLAVAAEHPDVRATLLDLPGPIERARAVVARSGLAERVELVAADALTWEPAQPFDTVLVSNILHMLGPERSQALLKRCLAFVRPGGRLIVQAEYLNADRTSPRWPTLLNLIMQATTDGGRNHDVDETADWLRAAGFVDVEHSRLSPWNVNSVLVAHRASEPAGSSDPGQAPQDSAP